MQQLLHWVQKNTCTQARTQVSLVPVTLLGPHTEPDHWEGIGGVDIRTVFFSDCTACVILAPRPGMKPTPSALKGEVVTPRPPGKSPEVLFLMLLRWVALLSQGLGSAQPVTGDDLLGRRFWQGHGAWEHRTPPCHYGPP